MFEQIYKKLTKDLENKKNEMQRIVEIVNSANKDRENATNELAELIKQAEQEKEEFGKILILIHLNYMYLLLYNR